MVEATETANAGSDASVGYLTSSKLTIGVEVTYKPDAFDSTGGHTDGSNAIFRALGNGSCAWHYSGH